MDKFLFRSIKLGLSLDLFSNTKSDVYTYTEQQEDELVSKLAKLSWVVLHVNQEFGIRFLNHSLLSKFSNSLISLEIGSRSESSPFPSLSPQIGYLTSLISLSIVSHDLKTLPAEFANLSSLKSLTISNGRDDNFTSVAEEITCLLSLTSLNLSSNKIQHIPSSISNLTNLTKLNLASNDLVELAPEIGELTSLRRLNISMNILATLPLTLGQLSNLERFDCSRNALLFVAPGTFQHMTKLEVLDLQSNRLTRLPHTVAHASVKELHLNDNLIETIPPQIGVQMVSLRKLILHHNRITRLPSQLEGLHKVKLLSVHSNYLDYVPYSIECLTSLKTLELSHNRLKELPPTMAFLQKLRRIELHSNSFATLSALHGINAISTLKSVQFDCYLQEGHSEKCMCKFCIYSRFDEAHFDDIVEGDSGFESELINLFFNCTENDFRAMQEALEHNNFHGIFFVSHKIKGALSNMGALKLSHLCTTLEKQARSQCISGCRDVFVQLQTEYGHIKEVLIRRLENHAQKL
jgi:Leucine-rich repeat (LRR) protein/HPt (histidine-containing phosphotransfer) domain-containing protein